MTNWHASTDFFYFFSLEYVDSWQKILLFRIHHLWNSTTKLISICIFSRSFSIYNYECIINISWKRGRTNLWNSTTELGINTDAQRLEWPFCNNSTISCCATQNSIAQKRQRCKFRIIRIFYPFSIKENKAKGRGLVFLKLSESYNNSSLR